MIQEEDVLSLKSISETHTNTSITLSISSLLRELIQVNMSSVEERLPYQQVMSYQSTKFLKVQPFATSNRLLVIKEVTQDVQVLTQPLSAILMMEAEPESDYHLVPEKPFQVFAEPPLVSLQVEEETKNQS